MEADVLCVASGIISINGTDIQNGCFLSQPPPLQFAQEVTRWTSAHWQAHSPRHSFRSCLFCSKPVRRRRKKPARQSRGRAWNGTSHCGSNGSLKSKRNQPHSKPRRTLRVRLKTKTYKRCCECNSRNCSLRISRWRKK